MEAIPLKLKRLRTKSMRMMSTGWMILNLTRMVVIMRGRWRERLALSWTWSLERGEPRGRLGCGRSLWTPLTPPLSNDRWIILGNVHRNNDT